MPVLDSMKEDMSDLIGSDEERDRLVKAVEALLSPQFNYSKLKLFGDMRDKAIRFFTSYPYRMRMPGMIVDLTDSDKQVLAYFEAAVEILNFLGVLDRTKLDLAMPKLFTEVQEPVNDLTD